MDIIEDVKNMTHSVENVVSDTRNTVEILVYVLVVSLFLCIATYVIKVFKCIRWTCAKLNACCCGSNYEEL